MTVISDRITEKYLKSLYYDIDSESGLSSVNKSYRFAKEDGKYQLTQEQVNDFLQGAEYLCVP